jgi:hypothetical protein
LTLPIEKLGVVMPVSAGRRDNVELALEHLGRSTGIAEHERLVITVVCDGADAWEECKSLSPPPGTRLDVVGMNKHTPGHEPPRNFGLRTLTEMLPVIEWVWFLDSDVIVEPGALEAFRDALDGREPDGVLCGPYDWGEPGLRELVPRGNPRIAIDDYRWAMFDEHGPEEKLRHHLGAALANFSGNLVWPVKEFQRTGGFHINLSAGRVDDGEYGVRAAVNGLATSFVAQARGLHVAHPVNMEWVLATNTREVPLINEWHPYIEQLGVIPVHEDGIRLNMICQECGEEINTLAIWDHIATHRNADPAYLTLPDLSGQEQV